MTQFGLSSSCFRTAMMHQKWIATLSTLSSIILAGVTCVSGGSSGQVPFHDSSSLRIPYTPYGGSVYDDSDSGLFTPFEDLNLLSNTQFTTLTHPAFPDYGVRVKKSKFCDGSVE
jgi:hypothetical protein